MGIECDKTPVSLGYQWGPVMGWCLVAACYLGQPWASCPMLPYVALCCPMLPYVAYNFVSAHVYSYFSSYFSVSENGILYASGFGDI